jgi:hypothetical protein
MLALGRLNARHLTLKRTAARGCSVQLPTSDEPPLTAAVEPSQSLSLGDGSCPLWIEPNYG